MQHRDIEEREIVDRYLQGRLPEEEATEFESHLLDCGDCYEQVRLADDMGQALRTAAAEDVARTEEVVRAVATMTLATRLARSRTFPGILAVLGLFLILGPSWLLFRERGKAAQMTAPQANTAIYTLGALRADSSDIDAVEVTLPDAPRWIVLTLPLFEVSHATYRAIVLDEQEHPVWQIEGLMPDAGDTIAVSLHSSGLAAGSYRLRLEGQGTGQQGIRQAAEFAFRVTE